MRKLLHLGHSLHVTPRRAVVSSLQCPVCNQYVLDNGEFQNLQNLFCQILPIAAVVKSWLHVYKLATQVQGLVAKVKETVANG